MTIWSTQNTWVKQFLRATGLAPPSCVILGKNHSLSVPQFFHVLSEINSNSIILSRELNEMQNLAQCLKQRVDP